MKGIVVDHPILIGSLTLCNPMQEKDDHGNIWGFNYYAEITTTPDTPLKALHDFVAKLSPLTPWFVSSPIPMYRVSVSRYMDARKAGAVLLDESEENELLELWLKRKST